MKTQNKPTKSSGRLPKSVFLRFLGIYSRVSLDLLKMWRINLLDTYNLVKDDSRRWEKMKMLVKVAFLADMVMSQAKENFKDMTWSILIEELADRSFFHIRHQKFETCKTCPSLSQISRALAETIEDDKFFHKDARAWLLEKSNNNWEAELEWKFTDLSLE